MISFVSAKVNTPCEPYISDWFLHQCFPGVYIADRVDRRLLLLPERCKARRQKLNCSLHPGGFNFLEPREPLCPLQCHWLKDRLGSLTWYQRLLRVSSLPTKNLSFRASRWHEKWRTVTHSSWWLQWRSMCHTWKSEALRRSRQERGKRKTRRIKNSMFFLLLSS